MLNKNTLFSLPLDKIAPPVAFVLIGLVMIITGGSGIFPFSIVNNPLLVEEPWRTIIGLLGIILVIVGPVLIWRESKNTKVVSQKEYGITIERDYYEIKEDYKVEISGTYKIKPPSDSLRTIIADTDRTKFWPQHIVHTFDDKNKTWKCSVHVLDPGKIIVFVIIIGSNGFDLWEYYCRVAKETNNKVHIPFVSLPKDTLFCGESTVNRLS